MGAKQRRQDQGTGPEEREKNIGWIGRLLTAWRVSDDERNERRERKKTDNPREGWEDGTPPPHRDFKMNVEPNESKPLGALGVQSVTAHPGRAGELRSAPSGPDDWHRVAGKRALALGVRVRREGAVK